MIAISGLVACLLLGQPADAARLERDRGAVVRTATARAAPWVVTIETIGGAQPAAATPASQPTSRPHRRGMFADPGFRVADGPTTGLVWSADGLIVTSSFNFVREPSIITITLADGRRFVGKLLGRDLIRRLALVRVEATDLPLPEWAAEGEIAVGQFAIALGRGFGGTAPSVSLGMVSAVGRRSGGALQCDAKLSPVNYGGPLVDLDGRVLGLIVPLAGGGAALAGVEWYDSGIGFAVVRPRIEASIRRMLAGETLEPGKLGVVLDVIPPDPEADPDGPARVRVAAVAEPSPAANAEIAPGDIIEALNGAGVGDIAELQRRLSDIEAGTEVTLRLSRDGEVRDAKVTLARGADIGAVAPPTGAGATTAPTSQPDS